MQNKFFGLFIAATLLSGVVRATEPSTLAQERATLCQSEVRAVLSRRGWSIIQDDAGKLTAERFYIPSNGTDAFLLGSDNSYARLQIDFQASDKSHINARGRASLYIYEPLGSPYPRRSQTAYPPLPLRDPKVTQDYVEALAAAEARLNVGQRVFVTKEPGNTRPTDRRIKLAFR